MFNYLLYISKPLELGSVDYGHCMWAERNVAMNAKINIKLYSSICSTLIGEVIFDGIYFMFLTYDINSIPIIYYSCFWFFLFGHCSNGGIINRMGSTK